MRTIDVLVRLMSDNDKRTVNKLEAFTNHLW